MNATFKLRKKKKILQLLPTDIYSIIKNIDQQWYLICFCFLCLFITKLKMPFRTLDVSISYVTALPPTKISLILAQSSQFEGMSVPDH